MKDFKQALAEESTYKATEPIVDYITSAEVVKLRKNEELIGYNQVCADVFFVKSGCLQGQVINEDGRERTVGFGLCGSMIYSAHCYTGGKGSVYRFAACCPSEVFRLPKAEFERKLSADLEFCRWILGAMELRVFFTELRNENLNGDASFKYNWLRKNRPEILQLVPDKVIASYLNITEVHLSRIKKLT